MSDGDRDAADCSVRLHQLTKSFAGVKALSDIDIEIKPGELFGFIGPDGAGKSTLFHTIAGVLEQTSGFVEVLGKRARDNRQAIGYLTQQFSLYPELSVDENLRYFAGTRSIPKKVFEPRRNQLLDLVDLTPFANRLAMHLSGGMKQKLALCCALIFGPQILLMDEPTTGLDPISRREFWLLLSRVAHSGVTTLIATPNFSEAELCDRVALLRHGEVLALGRPDRLRRELGVSRIQIRTDNLNDAIQIVYKTMNTRSDMAVRDVNTYGDRIDLLTSNKEKTIESIEAALEASGIASDTVCSIEEPTLENVYVMKSRQLGTEEQNPVAFPKSSQSTVSNGNAGVAIMAEDLRKNYGSFSAVEKVSLQIKHGEIYGLLGANGAGKTTTIKMLCGLVKPSAGKLRIGAGKLAQSSRALRQKIGYMSQKFTLYEDLSVFENLNYYASAYAIPSKERSAKIDWVLAISELSNIRNVLVKTLPQGLKQRIAFGAAVMHEPEILFLDEPTSGLDPLARRQLWKAIRQIAQSGTAILVSTHFLDDAEYCHRLGLMVSGKLIAEGSPQTIKANSEPIFEVVVNNTQKAYAVLSERVDGARISVFPKRMHVQISDSEIDEKQIMECLNIGGIEVERAGTIPPSLEDAFVQLVGKGSLD